MQNNHNDKYIKKLKDIADKNKGTLKSKSGLTQKINIHSFMKMDKNFKSHMKN